MNVTYNMNKNQIANKYNLKFDNHNDIMVINAMFAIKKLEIEHWIRDFNESNGFMFSTHENIYKLMDELNDDGHSGASAAITLRNCQKLLKLDDKDDKLPHQEIQDVVDIDIKPPDPPAIPPEPHNEPNGTCCNGSSNCNSIDGAGKSLGELYNNMDNNNKKAADVWASQGVEKAIDFMFKHPETGQKMDYATMRYYYG